MYSFITEGFAGQEARFRAAQASQAAKKKLKTLSF
jgi:hypothetical protein